MTNRSSVMDGTEFLRQASARNPHAAFIVISGYDDFSYAQSAIHYGASDYLLKPVVANELNEAIERVMTLRYPNEDFRNYRNMTPSEYRREQIRHTS